MPTLPRTVGNDGPARARILEHIAAKDTKNIPRSAMKCQASRHGQPPYVFPAAGSSTAFAPHSAPACSQPAGPTSPTPIAEKPSPTATADAPRASSTSINHSHRQGKTVGDAIDESRTFAQPSPAGWRIALGKRVYYPARFCMSSWRMAATPGGCFRCPLRRAGERTRPAVPPSAISGFGGSVSEDLQSASGPPRRRASVPAAPGHGHRRCSSPPVPVSAHRSRIEVDRRLEAEGIAEWWTRIELSPSCRRNRWRAASSPPAIEEALPFPRDMTIGQSLPIRIARSKRERLSSALGQHQSNRFDHKKASPSQSASTFANSGTALQLKMNIQVLVRSPRQPIDHFAHRNDPKSMVSTRRRPPNVTGRSPLALAGHSSQQLP